MKLLSHQLNPNLVSTAHQLDQLTSVLRGELPSETEGHYHVAGIKDNTLVIITDSPLWNTKLRQLGPAIIQTLSDNKIGKTLQHVRVISRHGPIKALKQTSQTVNRVLSEGSGQQVAQAAKYIKNDDLRKALLKLSTRSKKI